MLFTPNDFNSSSVASISGICHSIPHVWQETVIPLKTEEAGCSPNEETTVVATAAKNTTRRIRRFNFKERRFEIAVFCSSGPVGRSGGVNSLGAAHRAAATEEAKRSVLWKGRPSLHGVTGVPDHGRKQKNRADYRHHRPGRIVSDRAASRKRLRGPRSGETNQ